MEIALYDQEIEPWLERLATGGARLHAHVDLDIERFAGELPELQPEEKIQLLDLWSNPAVNRRYDRQRDFVLVTG